MKIKSKIKDYTLEMVSDVWRQRGSLFSNLEYGKLFFFVDENFLSHYKNDLKGFIGQDFCLTIEATEENKSFSKLADYYNALLKAGFTRNDVLVTFGGGVLQDISGFIASTLYRGIQWVFFPTTLLAQADSCIGSKTSINFDNSKNLIGTFYPPDRIYLDVHFCETLTAQQFNSGLGEIIKFHLLSNRQRFDALKASLRAEDLHEGEILKRMIMSTLEIKRSYFEEDEFDTGRRNLLNYGHCYGHALESASNFCIAHGEAVLVGMGFVNLLSFRRGLLVKERYEEIEAILRKYYPRYDLSRVKVEDIINYLKRDKKRTGEGLTMILAKDIGDHVKIADIKESEVISTNNTFVKTYPSVLHDLV